jgi:hypothetical protein
MGTFMLIKCGFILSLEANRDAAVEISRALTIGRRHGIAASNHIWTCNATCNSHLQRMRKMSIIAGLAGLIAGLHQVKKPHYLGVPMYYCNASERMVAWH